MKNASNKGVLQKFAFNSHPFDTYSLVYSIDLKKHLSYEEKYFIISIN